MPDSTPHGPQQDLGGPTSPEEPPLRGAAAAIPEPSAPGLSASGGFWRILVRKLRRRDKNELVREAIEELIEETPESDTPISDDQRVLLANIL